MRKFTALNNLPIHTEGKIKTTVVCDQWPDQVLSVQFYILNDGFLHELILGRDFLDKERTTLIYEPRNPNNGFNVQLLPSFDVCNIENKVKDKVKDKLASHDIDFDNVDRSDLYKLLTEIEDTDIPKSEDNYKVRINSRDTSVYAYAPRRFAYQERLQIQKIIDDLLKRKIIKVSSSPYCARIVPVKKKRNAKNVR